jgi:transcriptional regulator with GAF, ATPase, and Fis domain/tetratricopeptide (TPR) repeat protein
MSPRYQILEKLHEAGQDRAFLARDQLLNRDVVIKEAELGALHHEYRVLSRLRHPNLVQLWDLQAPARLVLGHAPGASFDDWAARDRSPKRVCRATGAVLRALQYVHRRGFVHRDVKPGNIKVDSGLIGRLPGVRLLDFGLATESPPAEVSGTRGYMAPEILEGRPASPASDLFALGVMLLEALTGSATKNLNLGGQAELGSLVASLESRVLAELLLDLLAPDPEHRPDHRAVFEALSHAADEDLELSVDELRSDYFPRPPLVGRDRQLERLRLLLSRARIGAPKLVQLTGAGKTSFGLEAVRLARLEGFEATHVDGLPDLIRAARIEAPADAGSGQLATRIVDGLLESDQPRMLLLSGEVLHGITVEVLRQIGRVDDVALLAIRDGDLPDNPTSGWQPLHLPELNPDQVTELVRGMLYHLDSIDWLDQVYPRTGGDPRAVVELVHAQVESGLPRRLIARPSTGAGWAATLAKLEGQPRRAAQLLALAPGPVPLRVLESASSAALEGLGWLLTRGLAVVTPRGVRLASPARDEGRGSDSDAELHRTLAGAWAEEPEPDPDAMAFHLLGAGRAGEAAKWLLRSPAATEESLMRVAARLEHDAPARLLLLARMARLARRSTEDPERALALAGQIAGQARSLGAALRVELLIDAGQPSEALELLGRASAVEERDAGLLRARARVLLGDFSSAVSEARSALERETDRERRVQLQNVLGLGLTYLGQAAEGLEVLRAAEAEARDLPELMARVLNSLGIALQRVGRLDEAAEVFGRCLPLFQELGDLRLAAATALNLGGLAQRRMELAEALAEYRKAAALGQRGALESTAAWAAASEANVLLLFGEASAAESRLERAARHAEGSLLGHLTLYRAEALRLRGRLGEALAAVEEARQHFERSDRPGHEAASMLECELRLLRGELDAAQRIDARLLAEVEGPDRWRALLLAGKVRLAEAPPRPERALELFDEARRTENEGERSFEIHAGLARCHELLGHDDRAAGCWRDCEDALQALRRRVPPQHRDAFDARPDIKALPRGRGAVPVAEGPSMAGVRRLLAINRQLHQALRAGGPPDRLLEHVLDGAVELTGAERGFILLEGRGGRLQVTASRNLDHEPVRRGVEKFSQSIAEQALRLGAPVVVADAMSDPRFREGLSVSALRLRAVLCIPLRVQEQRGALYVDNRFSASVFGEATVSLARAFADQACIVMESARLLHETAAQREALSRARDELEQANRGLADQVASQSEQLGAITVRLQHHEEELVQRYNAANLVGRSKAMRVLFAQIDRVASADVPVLIHGESGTGKELVARAIHLARTADRPFVAINCGAIPANLLESELFGYARGAFTGAERDRPGVFEAAGRGTLLLDEVGDMNLDMQVKLLRVLQEGTFRRLGDERERRSGCRVVAASHRRLAERVAAGRFREDLYYRLNVIELHVPPLRQRREDIPLLVQHFLRRDGAEARISAAAMRALIDFDWPGNVRQLENELRRAALLSDGVIEPGHLSPELRGEPVGLDVPAGGLRETMRELERRLIEETLRESGFNVTRAAETLKIHRVLLHRKMRLLGIGSKKTATRRRRVSSPE